MCADADGSACTSALTISASDFDAIFDLYLPTAARFASGMNCGKPPVGRNASRFGFFAMMSSNCWTERGKSSSV